MRVLFIFKTSMDRKIIIGIVALLAIGAAFFLYQKKQSPLSMMGGNTMMNTSGSGLSKVSGTMRDLLSRGSSLQCSFETDTDSVSSKGTVFVSGKNMRGDFESNTGGKTMMSSMIRDDQYMYTWSDAEKKGMKMKVDDIEKQAAEVKKAGIPAQDTALSLDDTSVDYSCKPWTVDQTQFTPPADVTFTDLTAQMEKMQKAVGTMKSTQCAACNNLPTGQAQDQCKASLGCN